VSVIRLAARGLGNAGGRRSIGLQAKVVAGAAYELEVVAIVECMLLASTALQA
jgi:hypothetical protein